jgi:hypothetical protein
MGPSNKEIQLRKNCQLYAYLLNAQGKEVPELIQECADSDDFDYPVECAEDLYEELKSLDNDTFDKIVNNTQSIEARYLAHWFEMQQEADRLKKDIVQTCL